jgi:cell wall-associated NlpC family hydrolase
MHALDCVGFVLSAYSGGGVQLPDPPRYHGSHPDPDQVVRLLGESFAEVDVNSLALGDVVVMRGPCGKGQHLGLWIGDAIVHADSSRGCVCVMRPHYRWIRRRVTSAWRYR